MKIASPIFSQRPALLMILISAIAVLVRLLFKTPLLLDESIELARNAAGLADQFRQVHLFSAARTLVGLPWQTGAYTATLSFSYLIIGPDKLIPAYVSLICSLCVVGLLYAIGVKLGSHLTGALAALLWAIFPLDIFVSSQLPITLYAALLCLSVYLYLGRVHLLWIPLLALLLVLNWPLALPVACLLFADVVQRCNIKITEPSLVVTALVFALFAYRTITVSTGLLAYSSAMLIRENLLIIPLLAISLATVKWQQSVVAFLITWFSFAFLGFLFLSPLSSLSGSIGLAPNWLLVCLPVFLLVGYQFQKPSSLPSLEKIALFIFVLLLMAGYFINQGVQEVFGLSRIALGLALVAVLLYIFLLQAKGDSRDKLFALFLVLLASSSLYVTKHYFDSYRYQHDDAVAILHALPVVEETKMVWVKEDLFNRFVYLNSFSTSLDDGAEGSRLSLLDPKDLDSVQPGDHVVVSEDFIQYVLGFPPSNWVEEARIQNSPQQILLLFSVTP